MEAIESHHRANVFFFLSMPIVNIGNARLYGLEEDLGLHTNQFQIAVSIFFVPYCVSEDFPLRTVDYITVSSLTCLIPK